MDISKQYNSSKTRFQMKKNIGRLDQIIRTGISLSFIYAGFIDEDLIYDPLTSNMIGTIGTILLVVAIVRSCPMYTLAGINTCQKNK